MEARGLQADRTRIAGAPTSPRRQSCGSPGPRTRSAGRGSPRRAATRVACAGTPARRLRPLRRRRVVLVGDLFELLDERRESALLRIEEAPLILRRMPLRSL